MRKIRLGPLILLLSVLALVAGVYIGKANWQPAPAGLPDAGIVVSWVLHGSKFANILLGVLVIGYLIVTGFIAPSNQGFITPASRKTLLQISAIASAWVLAATTTAVATLANVLGLTAEQTFTPGVIPTYIWALPPSRSYLIVALCALVIAIASALSYTLNQIAVLTCVALAGIATPLFNSHLATLGDHSLALATSVLHGVAISIWMGGLVAVASLIQSGASEIIERYSRLATVAFIAVTISGLGSAYVRMSSFNDLLHSPYGNLVLFKTGLLLSLALIALKVRRRISQSKPLMRLLQLELTLMAVALGLGVALHSATPSRTGTPFASAAEDLLGFAFPPAPTLRNVLLGWHPEWFMAGTAGIALAMYFLGVRRLRRNGVHWPVLRTLAFTTGIVTVLWSTSGGIAKYAMVSFSMHMLQHMTLSMLAPILLVLGTPITLALRSLPADGKTDYRNLRDWILAILHSPYARFVSHPLVALAIFTVGLYGMYFTPLFSELMGSHPGHLFMEIHFLATGMLFSWVVIGLDPTPRDIPAWARLLLVLVAISVHAFFAIAIMQSSTPIGEAWYSQVSPPWQIDPLGDTAKAGGIAWGLGEIPTLFLMVVVAVQWARKDGRLAKQYDRKADRDGDEALNAYNEQLARLHGEGQKNPLNNKG